MISSNRPYKTTIYTAIYNTLFIIIFILSFKFSALKVQSLHSNFGQQNAESFSPGLIRHFFFATGSNSQKPACAARGLIAVFVISYQCLQKAHLRMLGFFVLTTCQIAMKLPSKKMFNLLFCRLVYK